MITDEKKLRNFWSMVYDSAQKQCKIIEDETEEKVKNALSQCEDDCLLKAYNDIQKQLGLAKTEADSEILKAKTELQHALAKKRQEMMDEIFRSVLDKIMSFKETDEYESFLIKSAQKAAKEIGDLSDAVLYIDISDVKYENALKNAFPDMAVQVVCAEDRIYGGVRIASENAKKIIDNSIKDAIEREKEKFLSDGKLI